MRLTALFLVCVLACSTFAAERRAVRSPAVNHQSDQTESLMNQRIGAIEQSIAREEKVLQSRLAQIHKMRQAAITKNDEQELKKVELLERNAVQGYQQRVDQLLAGIANLSSAQTNQPAARSNRPQTRPMQNLSAQTRNQRSRTMQTNHGRPRQQQQQQQRNPRLRLWPFGK